MCWFITGVEFFKFIISKWSKNYILLIEYIIWCDTNIFCYPFVINPAEKYIGYAAYLINRDLK
ncbi:hypothetical protein A9255_00655 [Xenorhabdus hominickii]|uniref:Uncharacterized protein n=1 Tax=Xenorhabdus hominickii TaxID=351679 RepID=A0ABN4S0C5_XENHO|nr:hypothetical protein A9255_00655 [Xenorhabdus hominickii]